MSKIDLDKMPTASDGDRHLIVLKFGGMSLATPDHIKRAARSVAELRATGVNVLVVVSAMGAATDGLIQLAYSVSERPNRREFDMLLSTGERVSMSLFSMALSDSLNLIVPESKAISFTGSQAGLFTDETHSNARIIDVKSIRVQEELSKGNVVILAGFQGVSPRTKEITTLGRGGTDVTAVAMAAAFRATRCEILKEVPGVMSADPRVVREARILPRLSHSQLLDMTFWGAKVLHYRSVELAYTHAVPLRVSMAHQTSDSQKGIETIIQSGSEMNTFENDRVLAINSHSDVRIVRMTTEALHDALQKIKDRLLTNSLPLPQILHVNKAEKSEKLESSSKGFVEVLITAPPESLEAQLTCFKQDPFFHVIPQRFATLTTTCQGSYTTDLVVRLLDRLNQAQIESYEIFQAPLSVTFLIDAASRENGLRALHSLTSKSPDA
jgi:aspartate kinase